MGLCEKCGGEKIIASVESTGFPAYEMSSSKIEYCSQCEPHPPTLRLDVGDPVRHAARLIEFVSEEYECAIKFLDETGIPRFHNDQELSLVGRIRWAAGTFDFSDNGDGKMEVIRIKVNTTMVEYRHKDGSIGVPTGKRTSGGAKTIFGDHEVYTPHLAQIKMRIKPDGTLVDFSSDPVEAMGYDKPVVYYLFDEKELETLNKKYAKEIKLYSPGR